NPSKETHENQDSSELQYPIILNISFRDWKELDKWFNSHGLENRFAFTITHSEKNKEDGIPWHRTYKCTK
ncbi:44132_t:CDS:1, partial [Gigaspora margarita]